MAAWDGEGRRRDDDDFLRPPSAQSFMIPHPPRPEEIHPDTMENVQRQTEDIFTNFMYQTYRQNQIRQPYEETPVIQQFVQMPHDPVTNTAQIGRQLARIGDEINDRFADEFDRMIGRMEIDKDNVYDVFSNVARKVIANGLNWGRVIALLSFGFRMVISVVKNQVVNIPELLSGIISSITRFFLLERIFNWIAEQGGWIAALNFTPSASNISMAFFAFTAITSIAAVIYYKTFA